MGDDFSPPSQTHQRSSERTSHTSSLLNSSRHHVRTWLVHGGGPRGSPRSGPPQVHPPDPLVERCHPHGPLGGRRFVPRLWKVLGKLGGLQPGRQTNKRRCGPFVQRESLY